MKGVAEWQFAAADQSNTCHPRNWNWNLSLGSFLDRLVVVSARNSMITREHFKLLAAYNRWANARLYAAALDLSDLSYRLHTGVYFGSLHGTLNHLLLADRLWLKRLTGEGDVPNDLDTILYEDRFELTKARIAEDNRLVEVIGKYDAAALIGLHSYRTTSGMPQSQILADILLHLFNHQTHHRGQAHACLSILTGGEPPSLDLLAFQKGGPAPDLEKLIADQPADEKQTSRRPL
jgi:uncharacterized damage-inducible protein DinB